MTEAFNDVYRGRTVLVTGHTGFKGSWLALWLGELGAEVVGVALDPPSEPSHFAACRSADHLADVRADVRDYDRLVGVFEQHRPHVVFHLAAQPLVRRAFVEPRETFETNVMGTVNLLEAARRCGSVEAVVVATSDKCYRNVGWEWGYRETDPLGGHEPYAGSKACAELVVEVYQGRKFQANAVPASDVPVASARAGNVIGGGDWAADRLIPDIVRAIGAGRDVTIRNPGATRPWQHVLECLSGYLHLGARLVTEGEACAEPWNFGPDDVRPLPVADIVARMLARWSDHKTSLVVEEDTPGKEAQALRVDSSKAAHRLGWRPCWDIGATLDATVDWYRRHHDGAEDMRAFSLAQIRAYVETARQRHVEWAIAG